MNKNSVSKLQYAALAFVIPLVYKVAMLPSLLSREAGADAWLSVAVLAVLELAQLAAVARVSAAGGFTALKERMPKWLYIALSATVAVILVVKTAVFGAELANYAVSHLFYNIKAYIAVSLFMLAVFYIAARGGRALGRLAESAVWFLPILFVLGLAFGRLQLRADYILPVGAEGAQPIFAGADKYLFWTGNFLPLMFLRLDTSKKKENNRPYIAVAAAGGAAAVVGAFLIFAANFGAAAPLMDNAFARLAAFNVVSTEIGSIDWPGITVWLVMVLLAFTANMSAAAEAVFLQGRRRTAGVAVATLIATVLVIFVFGSIDAATRFATSGFKYFAVGAGLAVPAVVMRRAASG